MTYIFSSSILASSPEDVMYQWKTFMVARGYVVVSSSNGAIFSAGDIISSSNDLVPNLSFFILKQPLGATGSYGGWRREWGIQKGTFPTTYWRMSYTVSGSHNNGGSVTTLPSGSDRRWVLERNDASFPFGTAQSASLFPSPFPGTSKVSFCADNAAPYGWYMICLSTASNSSLDSCLIFDPMISGTYNPNDQDPYVSIFAATTHNPLLMSSANTAGMGEMNASSSVAGPRAWLAKGTRLETFCKVVSPLIYNFNIGAGNSLSASIASNCFTGGDDLFSTFYYRTVIRGAGAQQLAMPSGMKGYSSLLFGRASNQARRTGDTNSVLTTSDQIIVKDYCLPWDGTTLFTATIATAPTLASIAKGVGNGLFRSDYTGDSSRTPTFVSTNTSTGLTQTIVYRGRLGGQYVYSNNSPPGGGATDIIVVAIFSS